ncbi:MAG: CDP-alcohol phosphatidyltransferase family protein, partial [Xanthomonadales bacterium]|nr:CDP-alcohol phosphatidyltransferase family protein [Xanthomonadales bacterium]
DPLADKLMLLACFLVLTLQGLFPMWLLVLILARDLLIVAGATAYHFLVRPVDAAPSAVSKVNTFLQIALVLWVLLDLAWLRLPGQGLTVLVYLVAATTLASGIHYVWRWSILALRGGANGESP